MVHSVSAHIMGSHIVYKPFFFKSKYKMYKNSYHYTGKSILKFYASSYMYGRGMWRVWGRGDVFTGFWWGNLRERDHWGDPDVDGRIILRWIFGKWEGVVGTGWS